MKKISFLILILLILSISLFGCSKMVIEDTIKKFQDAVNKDDVDALKNVMSPDSDFSTVAEYNNFLKYFNGFKPLEYKNLDIDIDSNKANVNADGYYYNTPGTIQVLFVMKKVNNLFSFIFPDWRVYQYYDSLSGFDSPVWRKIKKLNSQ